MVHRTGYLFKKGDHERYIQVETILIFYKQEFISTGKHLLFEDETFIGHITASDGEYVTKGLAVLSEQEKAELILFLTLFKPPLYDPPASQFGFGIERDGNLTYCEVVLKKDLYEIWYDAELIAKLYQDEHFRWKQFSGERLQPSIVREITDRIQAHYSC